MEAFSSKSFSDFYFLHQWPQEKHVPRQIMLSQRICVCVACIVLDNIPKQMSTRQYSFLKTYIFIVNCLHSLYSGCGLICSCSNRGSFHCQSAACLWVPPHWFCLMVDVSETIEQNSFEWMLANWIPSQFAGCRCKWMLIDNRTVEAKMTSPRHHRSITLTETSLQRVYVNKQ